MFTDAEILIKIDAAFGDVKKPEHFTNYTHCEECAGHDELLRARDKETLRIEDVGNICWQPISVCTAEGFAYFLPALARMALSEPTYEYGWYGDTLEILLSSSEKFLAYCNRAQRLAVADFLDHLNVSRASLKDRGTDDARMSATAATWRA